ncbi:hypothetical protein MNBD_PLANCTO02-1481 [hydrothermal vent metagenome]|uniref:Uncharacterized protein n=1 Tax=hydrothermal vent metagenome TaxID=652676 RepID=A0A3B1DUU6_9ZZZZ
MQYLILEEIIDLQSHLLEQTGGMAGVRDQNGFESAIAQPAMMFDGKDLYPTIELLK